MTFFSVHTVEENVTLSQFQQRKRCHGHDNTVFGPKEMHSGTTSKTSTPTGKVALEWTETIFKCM